MNPPPCIRPGVVTSFTVMGNVPTAALPDPSVAVHVTIVVPSGNVVPEAGTQTGVTAPATASRADAV